MKKSKELIRLLSSSKGGTKCREISVKKIGTVPLKIGSLTSMLYSYTHAPSLDNQPCTFTGQPCNPAPSLDNQPCTFTGQPTLHLHLTTNPAPSLDNQPCTFTGQPTLHLHWTCNQPCTFTGQPTLHLHGQPTLHVHLLPLKRKL